MIDTPKIVQTTAQQTAVIVIRIPRSEIQKVMGPAIGEVLNAVTEQKIGPAGPVFSHHFRMYPEEFHFEVGVPVSAPVTPVGRVVASELPSLKVVQTIYHGPYEGLGAAWGEFESWIEGSGHRTMPNLIERYLIAPDSGLDGSKWQTELNHPLSN